MGIYIYILVNDLYVQLLLVIYAFQLQFEIISGFSALSEQLMTRMVGKKMKMVLLSSQIFS